MKYAAININFDSLAESYGFPASYRDPSFHEIADRFMDIAGRLDFKYSIYLIGKDLENPENRARVREWAEDGHEIGNHSWSHFLNLGSLPKPLIYEEVRKAHDVITETIGHEPEGFVAPGWATSTNLLKVLMELGYNYDTSTFPSILLYPALFKMLLNHIGDSRFCHILNRRDLHYPFLGDRKAYLYKYDSSSIVTLPLPTTRTRLACWHTTAFLFGWNIHKKILKACLNEIDFFYYLIHPVDLLSSADLDPTRKCREERLTYNLEHKIELLESAINEIANSGRKLITMQELAKKVKKLDMD